jgi:hypothetical protein
MTCANCSKKVVGGPKYSPESVLCETCAAEWLERHIAAQNQTKQPTDKDLLA